MSVVRNLGLALVFGLSFGVSAARVSGQVQLTAAGATFPAPLYENMIANFTQAHPNIKINYGAIGSGGGVKGFTEKTLDFAGSDAPLLESEQAKAGGADNIIQIPSCAGGVVPAYNLPDVAELKFSGSVLADIYMGNIQNWNDPQIAALNPGVNLPATAITPAYRSDASGTNSVWTNYLATQSPAFKSSIGIGKQVKFPVGQGGNGNNGVAAIVKQTPGAIGYIEQGYADQNKIQYGSVQNKNGKFVKASPDSVAAAGAGAADIFQGHVLKANIWNQPGDDAYPIASFTYLIAYKDLNNVKTKEQAQAVVDFFWFATHDGQRAAAGLFYAPLASAVQAKDEAAIAEFTYKGEAITPNK
jgi:phosphate transport system substrate-binding protein